MDMTRIPREKELANQIRQLLLTCAGDRIRHIILYGSRADGTAREDSDFDVLVVENGAVAKFEEGLRLRRALRGFPHPVDLWVMDEEEFKETRNVIGGLAYPASKYGVILQ